MPSLKKPESPRYLKLANRLRIEMATGKWRPGDRLPSCSAMKAEHGMSQNTWDRAYALLEREGLIVREPNRGVFVADRSSRTAVGVIGVATGEAPWQHPYYAELLKGIHRAAHEADFEVLLLSPRSPVKWERVDGVISLGKADASAGKLMPGMPRVTLLHSRSGGTNIVGDDTQGITSTVQHLVSLGHRRIAYLAMETSDSTDIPTCCRITAYREALADAGIRPEQRWIRPLRGLKGPMQGFTILGRDRMAQWLREDWNELGCTALLCQNDETAISVIAAVREVGLQVPGDVSVTGFDGTEIGTYFRPSLTTVEVPLQEIGASGIEVLLAQIAGHSPIAESGASQNIVLPVRFKIGESSAAFVGSTRREPVRRK